MEISRAFTASAVSFRRGSSSSGDEMSSGGQHITTARDVAACSSAFPAAQCMRQEEDKRLIAQRRADSTIWTPVMKTCSGVTLLEPRQRVFHEHQEGGKTTVQGGDTVRSP